MPTTTDRQPDSTLLPFPLSLSPQPIPSFSQVATAKEAHKTWGALPGHVRARHIYSIARHVQKHHRLVSVVESLDNGKPFRETRDADVEVVVRWLYHYAGWAQVRCPFFSLKLAL